MRVILSGLLWLVLSSAALAQDQRSVDQHTLLREEQVEAAQRQQQELESRATALSEQTKTAKQLLQRQQQYIEQLEAQIRALQEDTPDSDD